MTITLPRCSPLERLQKISLIKKQPKIEVETDWQLLRRNKLLVLILLVQALACFCASQVHQTNDFPELLWRIVRYATLGVLIAQLPMLGIFVSLFPAKTVFRFSVAVTWMIASVSLILAGDNFGRRPGLLLAPVSTHLASLPLQVIGWSIPFFVAKSFSRWRLSSEAYEDDGPNVSIFSLLVGTAVIAFGFRFLTLGNQSLPLLGITGPLLGAGIGFAFLLPITAMLFKTKQAHLVLVGLNILLCLTASAIFFILSFAVPKFVNQNISGSDFQAGLTLILTILTTYALFLIATRNAGVAFHVGNKT